MCQVSSSSSNELVPARIKQFDDKPILAWKKAKIKIRRGKYPSYRPCIVKLLIPARATRFQPRNHKCRASSAHVVAIYEIVEGIYHKTNKLGAKTKRRIAYSKHDIKFKYVVGKKVKPTKKFNKNHKDECSTGIHFFLTAREAANY
jgi:hypothetical protein